MDDLISRQAAIEAILHCENHDMEHDYEFNEGLIAAMNAVEELPTAEKRGKWKERKPPEGSWGYGSVFTCSECGEEVDCVSENFCPNCGARMEKNDETDRC